MMTGLDSTHAWVATTLINVLPLSVRRLAEEIAWQIVRNAVFRPTYDVSSTLPRGELRDEYSEVVKSVDAALRAQVRAKRLARALIKRVPPATPWPERAEEVMQRLVFESYDRCSFRTSIRRHVLEVCFGSADVAYHEDRRWCGGRRPRQYIYKTQHTLWVPRGWIAKVKNRAIDVLVINRKRCLILDAEWIDENVFRATFVRQGRGLALVAEHDVYLRRDGDRAWRIRKPTRFTRSDALHEGKLPTIPRGDPPRLARLAANDDDAGEVPRARAA